MRRIVFVNLHGNEFLVKTLNKILFGQSVAIKHGYILDYLLNRDDIEVCSYINKRGLALSYTTRNPFLQAFRFFEHRWTMRKNGIPQKKIKVLKDESEIRPDDIVVCYAYYHSTQFDWREVPDATRVVCEIHFGTAHSDKSRQFDPHALYNESNLQKYSEMWQRDLPWFTRQFITIPFVPQSRFRVKVPFEQRKNKAVGMGTITYMHNITGFYGDSCAQPARRNCRVLAAERNDLIDSFNFDYNEDRQDVKRKPTKNRIISIYRRLYDKIHGGHQKKYYSFDMVDKFNEYRMAVVGEEIMGIPGIGFVEAMACGCAMIGQTKGYYEDYGMQEGVHYIGYDGTKEDIARTIEYWQQARNQDRLAQIAEAGQRFVSENFRPEKIAANLTEQLLKLNTNQYGNA